MKLSLEKEAKKKEMLELEKLMRREGKFFLELKQEIKISNAEPRMCWEHASSEFQWRASSAARSVRGHLRSRGSAELQSRSSQQLERNRSAIKWSSQRSRRLRLLHHLLHSALHSVSLTIHVRRFIFLNITPISHSNVESKRTNKAAFYLSLSPPPFHLEFII